MSHDDFELEPVPGLPEAPPEGEHILWQGKPDWWALACEALMVKWVMVYFVFLGVWRTVALLDIQPVWQAIWGSTPFLIMGIVVCVLLTVIAWVMAYATIYTITNRRVAMRIGAALNVTLNLPYRWIESADLDLRKTGTGTIALTLGDDGVTKLSYLMCWPHVRPWKMNPTQPALRCIKDAENVAGILGTAARTQVTAQKSKTAEPNAVPAE